jgi:hypothetical protein
MEIIPEAFKRNKSIIKHNLNILRSYSSPKSDEITIEERKIYINKDTFTIHDYSDSKTTSKPNLLEGEYRALNSNYEIRPVMMVKNYQSKYRDLSVVGFLNEINQDQILDYLKQNRFYTVIYSIRLIKHQKEVLLDNPIKSIIIEKSKVLLEPLPSKRDIEIIKPSYLSIVKQTPSINDLPNLKQNKNQYETTSESSGSGSDKSTREYDNVKNYYHKFGDSRMYILFQNTINHTKTNIQYRFSNEDKKNIRSLLNGLLVTSEKLNIFINDNNYYYIKVIKSFHYDRSGRDNSIHFNIILKAKYTESDVFHIYTNIERNKVLTFTRTENII